MPWVRARGQCAPRGEARNRGPEAPASTSGSLPLHPVPRLQQRLQPGEEARHWGRATQATTHAVKETRPPAAASIAESPARPAVTSTSKSRGMWCRRRPSSTKSTVALRVFRNGVSSKRSSRGMAGLLE